MRANIKTNIKRGIAVGLITIMAAINPMQTLQQPTGAGAPAVAKAAETDKAPYIGEVRLAVDKDAGIAKQTLESEGYEVIDQDLNEKAGSFWNDLGDQAVYMGIKRTDDASKAIRDMKTMNMLGKYSYSGLKEKLEVNKKEAKELYQKILAGINEFADNYENKDVAAQSAYSMMNLYIENDSGKLVGDYILGKPDEEDVMKVLAQGNTYGVAAMLKALIYGSEKGTGDGAVWTERLSKVTSYNALVKKYAQEIYGKDNVVGEEKEQVEKLITADLDKPARALLSQWPEIRRVFTSAPESDKKVMDFDGEISDIIEAFEISEDAGNSVAANYAKSIPYGKKTAYDLFTVSSSLFEKNIKNLYPLVYALSPAQRSLVEVASFTDLFQASLLRQVSKEDKDVKKDITETQTSIEKNIDVVSIYDGVDRAMYADNAAMTSKATAVMEGQGAGNAILTLAIGGALAVGAAVTMTIGIRSILSYKAWAPKVADLQKDFYKLLDETFRKDEMKQGKLGRWWEYPEVKEAKDNLNNAKKAQGSVKLGAVLVVVSVIMAAVSVYMFYKTMKNEYNHEQLPIPDVLVDYDVQNKAGKNVAYHAVKWNKDRGDTDRADRADLNGDAAIQWLALYTTTDKTMGDPILADSLVAKTGLAAGRIAPGENYVPLTMFGEEAIQNLVDSNYSYNDEVGGIWLWYQKGNTTGETVIDDTEEAEEDQATAEAVSGDAVEEEDLADTTGSNIGGGNTVLIALGGGVAGIIAGIFIGFFIRRKKQSV